MPAVPADARTLPGQTAWLIRCRRWSCAEAVQKLSHFGSSLFISSLGEFVNPGLLSTVDKIAPPGTCNWRIFPSRNGHRIVPWNATCLGGHILERWVNWQRQSRPWNEIGNWQNATSQYWLAFSYILSFNATTVTWAASQRSSRDFKVVAKWQKCV